MNLITDIEVIGNPVSQLIKGMLYYDTLNAAQTDQSYEIFLETAFHGFKMEWTDPSNVQGVRPLHSVYLFFLLQFTVIHQILSMQNQVFSSDLKKFHFCIKNMKVQQLFIKNHHDWPNLLGCYSQFDNYG